MHLHKSRSLQRAEPRRIFVGGRTRRYHSNNSAACNIKHYRDTNVTGVCNVLAVEKGAPLTNDTLTSTVPHTNSYKGLPHVGRKKLFICLASCSTTCTDACASHSRCYKTQATQYNMNIGSSTQT